MSAIEVHKSTRYVGDGVPIYFGSDQDSRIVYDGTSDEWTVQSKDSGGTQTDRVQVKAGQDVTSLTLYSDDPGATGIQFDAFHESASPTASDILLDQRIYGEDDAGNKTQYGGLTWTLTDPADGSEDGRLAIKVMVGGTLTDMLQIDSSGFDMKSKNVISVNEIQSDKGASTTDPIYTSELDASSGFGFGGTNSPLAIASGAQIQRWTSTQIYIYQDLRANNANGPALYNESSSATNPTVLPDLADADTGIGGVGGSYVSTIVNGGEIIRAADTLITLNQDVRVAGGFGAVVGNSAGLSTAGSNTSAPEFQVLGTASPDASTVLGRFSNDESPPKLVFVKSRDAAITGHTIVQDNDAVGGIEFAADDGSDYRTIVAEIRGVVDDGAPASNSIGGFIGFYTASGSSADDLAIRFAVDSNGALRADNANGPALYNEATGATNPTLLPDRSDADTGIGGIGGSYVSAIVNSEEILRMSETALTFSVGDSGAVGMVIKNETDGGSAHAYLQLETNSSTTADGYIYFKDSNGTVQETYIGVDTDSNHALTFGKGSTVGSSHSYIMRTVGPDSGGATWHQFSRSSANHQINTSGQSFYLMSLTGLQVNGLTSGSPFTATQAMLNIGQYTAADIGGAATTNHASGIRLTMPIVASATATLAKANGLFIRETGTVSGTFTEQSAIEVETMSKASTNYYITLGSSDTDHNLIHVGVTGDPIFGWDESEDQFTMNKGLTITSGELEVGTVQTYTPTNVTTDRAFDADTVAITELADVVGTLISDLQTIGLVN